MESHKSNCLWWMDQCSFYVKIIRGCRRNRRKKTPTKLHGSQCAIKQCLSSHWCVPKDCRFKSLVLVREKQKSQCQSHRRIQSPTTTTLHRHRPPQTPVKAVSLSLSLSLCCHSDSTPFYDSVSLPPPRLLEQGENHRP